MSTEVTKQEGVSIRRNRVKEHFVRRGVDIIIDSIDSPREMETELKSLMTQGITQLVVAHINNQFPLIQTSHEAIVEHTAEIYDAIERAHFDLASILKEPDLRMLNVVKGTETSTAIESALNWAKKQVLRIPPQDLKGLLRQDTTQSYLC